MDEFGVFIAVFSAIGWSTFLYRLLTGTAPEPAAQTTEKDKQNT